MNVTNVERELAVTQVYRVQIDAPVQDVWDTLTKQGEPTTKRLEASGRFNAMCTTASVYRT